MDNEKKKPPYWTKSRSDYEAEIKKIMAQQKESLRKKTMHEPTSSKWGDAVWEQVAHELVYVIGLLEEDPTYPKNWRKVFRVLRTYENLCRDNPNER